MSNKPRLLSRIINAVKKGSPIRPSLTADMISSVFVEHNDTFRTRMGDHSAHKTTDNLDMHHSTLQNADRPSIESRDDNLKMKKENTQGPEATGPDGVIALANKGKKQKGGNKNNLPASAGTNKLPEKQHQSLDHSQERRESSVILDSLEVKEQHYSKGVERSKQSIAGRVPLLGKKEVNSSSSNHFLAHSSHTISKNDLKNMFEIKQNEKVRAKGDPSITVNVGKITVRATSHSPKLTVDNNGSSQPAKLSLGEYLKKRAVEGKK